MADKCTVDFLFESTALGKLCRSVNISPADNDWRHLLELFGATLDDLMHEALTSIIEKGEKVETSRGATQELVGVLLELENPRARLSLSETRGLIFSCLGELFWYLSASGSLKYIEYYISKYKKESEDGASIYGAYGPRIFDTQGVNQLDNVIALLKKKPRSRRAVVQIFQAADLAYPRTEVPCTCSLQFLMPADKLTLIVNMRSNDAFIGLPHDVFAFTMIQEIVARALGVEVGPYRHFVGSLHLYQKNRIKADAYLAEGFQGTQIVMPDMPIGDPWSSIEVLKEAEATARESRAMPDAVNSLDPYWQDLARMFQVFSASKVKNEDWLRELALQMSHPIYSRYIESTIEIAAKQLGHQHRLDLSAGNAEEGVS